MATDVYNLENADGWVKIASNTASNVIIENGNMVPFHLTFVAAGGSAPNSGTEAYHVIDGRARLHRETLNTDVYAKNPDDYSDQTNKIVVSQD